MLQAHEQPLRMLKPVCIHSFRRCITAFLKVCQLGPLAIWQNCVFQLGRPEFFTIFFLASFTLRLLQVATKDDEAARTQLLQTLIADALDGGTSKTQITPANLAQRELPPGNWSQLYVLYQAWCLSTSSRCASRAAFYACSKEWRKALRFRPHSKHSVCHLCDTLKSRMKHASNFMAHAKATDNLLEHLSNMWRCRQAYWLAREKSRATQDLLTIIYDGFDKAKPAIPRWSRGQAPKQAAVERIPRSHLAVYPCPRVWLRHLHG